jgi:hypothetical protein
MAQTGRLRSRDGRAVFIGGGGTVAAVPCEEEVKPASG